MDLSQVVRTEWSCYRKQSIYHRVGAQDRQAQELQCSRDNSASNPPSTAQICV